MTKKSLSEFTAWAKTITKMSKWFTEEKAQMMKKKDLLDLNQYKRNRRSKISPPKKKRNTTPQK